jgi:MYXO-CTERM domain-containing protein
MSQIPRALLGASAFFAAWLIPVVAHAQCCPGYSPASACSGVTLTKSRWCIEDTVPTGQRALPQEFCAYGDVVVTTLEKVFNIPAKETFEFELDSDTGGAHTGTACGRLGDGVAYDAFTGSAYGATGFWGYLLSLHEAINDWTGMSSPGWPTDFWADHQSAFPNLMDFHIMNTIGMTNGDQNLIKAAAAQKKRFFPNGDTADPKVVALDNVFAAMPNGDGYAGFSKMFALQSGDGVRWDGLGVPNPDVKRTEYVVAYMSLAAQQKVLSILQGPGANGGGEICNGTPDGTAGDKPYVCDQGHIDAIATAHCAIAANAKPKADLTTFRSGSYTGIPSGPCGATCPGECACDAAMHCVASWLGKPSGNGGSGGATGTGGTATPGGSSGMNAGGSGGANAGGSGGAGGSPATTGGNRSTGGSAAGGTSGVASGGSTANGTGGRQSGGSGGSAGSAGSAIADGGSSATSSPDAGHGASASSDSGCGCRIQGPGTTSRHAHLLATALGIAALARRRRRSG